MLGCASILLGQCFPSRAKAFVCYLLTGMTVIETIIRGVKGLSLREQVDVACYVHRLSPSAQRERAELLRQTHGALNEADGLAFEQAMEQARRLEEYIWPC